MSQLAIATALEKAVKATDPAFATAWENKDFTPPAATVPWQRVTTLFARPRNDETGGSWVETGFMQVDLFFPLKKWAKPARERAEVIRAAFPVGSPLTEDGVVITITETPEITRGEPVEDRYAVTVRVRFSAQLRS